MDEAATSEYALIGRRGGSLRHCFTLQPEGADAAASVVGRDTREANRVLEPLPSTAR